MNIKAKRINGTISSSRAAQIWHSSNIDFRGNIIASHFRNILQIHWSSHVYIDNNIFNILTDSTSLGDIQLIQQLDWIHVAIYL